MLNSCKLQIVFNSQRKLSNVFCFKDCLPSDLVSGVVCKYVWYSRCNSTYYGETNRQFIKLGLENILGYHLWHLRKLNHHNQRKAQFVTIFWIAIITSCLLRSLPFWQMGWIINSFFKSKKVYLSKEIDLFWIKTFSSAKLFLFDNSLAF